jgi:hypothetical protein
MHVTKLERVLVVIIDLVWVVVTWALAIGKIHNDGITLFFSHLTNWAWTGNAIYFALDLLMRWKRFRNLFRVLVQGITFFTVMSLTLMVFWLVWIALKDNPGLLENETKEHGGKFDAGFVFDMNTVFHVLPTIFVIVHLILRRDEFTKTVGMVTDVEYYGMFTVVLLGALISFIGPAFVAFCYAMAANARKVYGIEKTPMVYVILLAFGVLIVHSVTPYAILALNHRDDVERRRKRGTIWEQQL